MEPVETIKYKGYDINIYQDDNAESPESWGDDEVFLVAYYRDFSVDRGKHERIPITIFKTEDFKKDDGYNGRVYEDKYGWKSYEEAKKEGLLDKQTTKQGKYIVGISKELAIAIFKDGKDEDGDETINKEAKTLMKKYYTFGLEAYIHSGVVLALSYEGNFPDRRWDVSQLGIVFVKRVGRRNYKTARKLAQGLIETWNDYLSENVYGFKIMLGEKEIDSCWGFYGDTEDMIKECKSTIDSDVEQKLKENSKKLKSFIKNKTPLQYRQLKPVG